jgi:hypothetical protein
MQAHLNVTTLPFRVVQPARDRKHQYVPSLSWIGHYTDILCTRSRNYAALGICSSSHEGSAIVRAVMLLMGKNVNRGLVILAGIAAVRCPLANEHVASNLGVS